MRSYEELLDALHKAVACMHVGDIMFEAIYWPNIISIVDAMKRDWQLLTWAYPLERVIIAIAAALIGTALVKASKAYDLRF